MPVTYQQTKWEVLSPESVLPGTCRTKGAWAATWVVRKTILGAFSHLEVSVFAPLAVLPQLPAVVTPEGNNGGVSKAKVLQHIQHSGDGLAMGRTPFSYLPISSSTWDMEE